MSRRSALLASMSSQPCMAEARHTTPVTAVTTAWATVSQSPMKQRRGLENEDVGHDIGRDGQLEGGKACLHGVGVGNGRPGVGDEADRRRQPEVMAKYITKRWAEISGMPACTSAGAPKVATRI